MLITAGVAAVLESVSPLSIVNLVLSNGGLMFDINVADNPFARLAVQSNRGFFIQRNSSQALVALLQTIASGNPKFFLGTDSAPHAKNLKESSCGCAGIFSANAAIELYTTVFESIGALDKLEAFASFHGPDFYGLPRNSGTITLEKVEQTIPESYPMADQVVVPLMAGQTIPWKIKSENA